MPTPLLLLLAACGSGSTSLDTATSSDPDTAPYLGEVEGSEAPTIDNDALGEGLDLVIASLLHVKVDPVLAVYDDLMATADDSCPNWYDDDGITYWYDSCTSDAGTTFEGYAYLYDYVDYLSDGTVWNGRALYGAATIVDGDGNTFEAKGQATAISGPNSDGNESWWTAVDSFTWDGAGAEGTWLADGLAPGLSWYAVYVASSEGRVLQISGSLSGTAGIDAVALDEVMLANTGMGSTCPEEPSGSIAVLDGEGNWIDIVFDGPTWETWAEPAADCDGCGQAWFQGQDLGLVCADFSPLTDWGASPG
jgi:hypothetical protein